VAGRRRLAAKGGVALLLLAASGAAAIIAGCGSERPVPVSSLSRAQFIERADAICAEGRRRGLRYRPSLADGETGAAAARAIEVALLPAIGQVVDDLYAIGAPAAQRERMEAFLSELQRAVSEAESFEVPTFERLDRAFASSGKLALELGLRSCAYG
jgi:hypothetical protein